MERVHASTVQADATGAGSVVVMADVIDLQPSRDHTDK
jgi:hypothetical protein